MGSYNSQAAAQGFRAAFDPTDSELRGEGVQASVMPDIPTDTDAHFVLPPLHLEMVVLQDFKSYKGTVNVGPFNPAMTTIVGANGCGKSCLVEAICFTLGIGSAQLRSHTLEGLVHQGVSHGNASVTLFFSARPGCSTRSLTVRRKVIGGKRSEVHAQDCRCASQSGRPPWKCDVCYIASNVKRNELREMLLRALHLDIDSPERFVVQQAGVLGVAQRSPCDLLRFLEELVGTQALRIRLEEALALAATLRSEIDAADAEVQRERLQMQRYEGCLASFEALERCRVRLQQMKAAQLHRELPMHRASLQRLQAQLNSANEELRAREAARHSADGVASECASRLRRMLGDTREARRAVEAGLAELERKRDEMRRGSLKAKQREVAVKRALKSIGAAREHKLRVEEQERVSQMEIAKATHCLREAREALSLERAKLLARERLMDQCIGLREETNDSSSARMTRKRPREQLADDSMCVCRAVEIEVELREMHHSHASGEAERHEAAARRWKRLTEELALARETRRLVEAERSACEAAHREAEAQAGATATALRAAEEATERLAGQLEEARGRREAAAARLSRGASAEALHLRARVVRAAQACAGVRGFLCECFFVSDQFAKAVNAALAAALQRTVVVDDKAAALSLVEQMRRQKAGVISCLILSELTPPFSGATDALPPAPPKAKDVVPLAQCVQCAHRDFSVAVPLLFSRWSLVADSQAALALGREGTANLVTLDGACFLSSGEIRLPPPHSRDEYALRRTVGRPTFPLTSAPGARPTEHALRELHAACEQIGGALRDSAAVASREAEAQREADSAAAAAYAKAHVMVGRLAEADAEVEELEMRLSEMRASGEVDERCETGGEDGRVSRRRQLEQEAEALRCTEPLWHQLHPVVEALRAQVLTESERLSAAERQLRATARDTAALEAREGSLEADEARAKREVRESHAALAALEREVHRMTERVKAQEGEAHRSGAKEQLLRQESGSAAKALAERCARVREAEEYVRACEASLAMADRAVRTVESQLGEDERGVDGEEAVECAPSEGADSLGSGECSENRAIEQGRVELMAEERVFAEKQERLDVTGLGIYLDASTHAQEAEAQLRQLRAQALDTARRVEAITAERARIFVPALGEIDRELRMCFRSLVPNGECCLDFSTQPQILFAEGVQVSAKPADSEWMRFDQLSGGQKAIVAVALNLSFQVRQQASLCIFDEIDAALDTRRTQALARHVAARVGSQAIFVSHRPSMIEAANVLIGVYSMGGCSETICVNLFESLGRASS